MNSLFAFAIILSASAVFSSPLPKSPDLDNPIDFDGEWKKHFPDVKIIIPRPPHFNFPAIKDPFSLDDKNVFDDSDSLVPRKSLFSTGFSDDFFKSIREKFLPKNATNNTVENTREVDGHVIHEKESTYSNGDGNSHVVFKQKTVIIRPKDGVGKTDKNFGNEDRTFINSKPVESVPKFNTAFSGTSNKNNPDEDVEMVHLPESRRHSEAIREGNSIDNVDYVVDLSKDTRINDLYKGPTDPRAVLFDVNAKSRMSKENPNAPIGELNFNELNEEKNDSAFVNLEHDTDVNAKTANLKLEPDAEIIDTNAIRRKRTNKHYLHYT